MPVVYPHPFLSYTFQKAHNETRSKSQGNKQQGHFNASGMFLCYALNEYLLCCYGHMNLYVNASNVK